MKKGLTILAIAVVVFFVLGIAKDLVIKVGVEKGVEFVTGLKLKVGTFRVGVMNTLVDIKNLELFNPPGFDDRTMAEMPEIYVDYDLGAALKGTVHVTKARISLREFVVVKDKNGRLNLDSLKVVQAQKDRKQPAGKAPRIQIDSLELKIGKAIYKDYSRSPSAPLVKEFTVNLDEKYSNIRDPYSLVSLIVVKALANTAISGLSGFDLKGLEGTISGTLATAHKVAAQTVTKAKEVVATTQATAQSLKDVLKNPFGGSESEE